MVESFWVKKTHTSNKFDIIACGDSRVYRGIASDVLYGQKLNLSFINLGYSSAGFSEDYLHFVMSKFRLESKNKVLIVGITPHSFTNEAKKNEALNQYLNISEFKKFRYKYLFPILKYFASYKPSEFIKKQKKRYQERFNNDGWVASDNLFPDSTSALESYRKTFTKYKVSMKETKSIMDKLKKIASTEVTIIALRPPTTKQMRMLEDSMSGFDEDFVKQELIRNSITWLDFNDSDFMSYDGSHLNENSARKLSVIIGKKINEILSHREND